MYLLEIFWETLWKSNLYCPLCRELFKMILYCTVRYKAQLSIVQFLPCQFLRFLQLFLNCTFHTRNNFIYLKFCDEGSLKVYLSDAHHQNPCQYTVKQNQIVCVKLAIKGETKGVVWVIPPPLEVDGPFENTEKMIKKAILITVTKLAICRIVIGKPNVRRFRL